jgi:formate hydrogenlyase transcriptional activator
MKVLYVEDDQRDADLTIRRLRKSAPHLEFETVSTIAEAIARMGRLSSEPLDVVLSDLHLADGDGLLLLNHIRENSLPVAVVVITGMGDEDTAVTALKNRADDYVVKRTDYIDRLPVILESAFSHYNADASRRAKHLQVLYGEANQLDLDRTKRHLAVHADHIRLHPVSSGSKVLQDLNSQNYDVVLLNFKLPDSNPFDILRELRLTHKQDTPVVLVCIEDDEELAQEALKRGVSNYLVKRPGYLYQLPWELEQAHSRADLQRREAALHASEERNRAILDAIPDLMFVLDRDGIYVDYHAKSPDLLIRPPHEFLGKNFMEVLPPDVATRLSVTFNEALTSDKPVLLEYTVDVPSGNKTFESSMVRCEDDKILSMVRDITDRKESQLSLRRALEEVQLLKDQLHAENIYLQEEIRLASDFGQIIGSSEPLKRVLQQAEQVAPIDTTVLILGETGTGKELLAHAIHNLSPRKERTFVKVNCAALPAPLIESELFGHEKGAFTGADTRRTGRFELAAGGTIFLDEVGELPIELQAKLLRVLEEGEFELVGGSRTLKVDVRVIAATNRNLEEEVRQGSFRSDLYYRLRIFPITLPSLRERRDDIPVLVKHFVKQLSKKFGRQIESVPHEVMTTLRNYSWPGNVRELRNVIERAVIITQGTKLRLTDGFDSPALALNRDSGELFPDQFSGSEPSNETLQTHEHDLILRTLKTVHWKLEGPGGAAALLDIHPSTLRSRMRKLGIERPRV